MNLNNYNCGDLKTWYALCLRIIIIKICGLNYFNYTNSFQKQFCYHAFDVLVRVLVRVLVWVLVRPPGAATV